MRKFIVLMALASLFSFTSAHASVREGLYAGAGCGATFDHFVYRARNIDNGNVVNRKGDKTHWLGTAFLGYGATIQDCFYVAAEVGTSFPKRSITVHRRGVTFTDDVFTNHMSVQEYVYGDILAGYRLASPWLIYGRVGVSYAHLHLSQDAATVNGVFVDPIKKSQNKAGLRIGAGINFKVNDWVGLGIDYVYTDYSRTSEYKGTFSANHSQKTNAQSIVASLVFGCWP